MNYLKKWLVGIAFVFTSFTLAACSESAEEVYTRALEAAEKMESAEVSTVLNQEISMANEGKVTIESDMEGSVVLEPLAMHQKGKMAMSLEGEESLNMDTEIYLVDDEMYVFESLTNQWIKADSSLIPIETLTADQPNVTEQLKMVEDYIQDLEFEEKDNEFIFKLTADGEDFKKLTQQMLEEYLPEDITNEIGDLSTLLEEMDIKKLSVEMVLDNKTYDLKKYNLVMEMTMNVEGEEISIIQNVKSTYKKINTIDKIEVPQEVKDDAVDAS